MTLFREKSASFEKGEFMAKPLTITAREQDIEQVIHRGRKCFRLTLQIFMAYSARAKMARPLKSKPKKSPTSIQPPAEV
jgi:hypothetical protein